MAMTGSVRLKRDLLAIDRREGVHGGLLLGFLLVPPPGGGIAVAGDDGSNLESLAMVGAFLVEELILRRSPKFALRDLLKQRLVIAAVSALGDLFDLRPHVAQDEAAGRFDAAVEVDSRHQ